MASYELKGPTAVKWGYGSNNWQTISSGGTYSFGKTSSGVNYVAMFQFTIPSGITNISQIILYAYGYPNTDGGAIAGRTTVARLSTSTPYNTSGSTTVNQWVNFTGYLSQSNTNAIKTPLGNTYRTYSYAFTSGLSTLTAGSKIFVYILGVDNSSYSDALRTTQYPYLDITYGNTTPTTYRITYYKNDGSGTSSTPSDQSALTSGSSYTLKYLSQLGWSRSGYTFKGWGSSSSATSTSSAGTSKTCYGNTSWYAIWTQDAVQYTVKFYPGDHATVSNTSANAISRTYTKGGSLTLLSNNAFTGETSYTYYTTNYYLQGGDVTSYNYPSSSSNYTRSGSASNYCYSVRDDKKSSYSYEYWRGSDTSGVRKCGDTYSNLDGNINMWPNWSEAVNYNAQFNPPNASRTGYKLTGWATSPAGTPNYQSGTRYSQSSNQNLYAIWEANEFKITFSPGNYGSGSSRQLTTTNGQLTTLSADYFTRPAGTTYYSNYYLQGGTMSTPSGFSVNTSTTYGPHYQTSNKTTYYHNYWNNDPNGTPQSGEGVNYWNCNKTYTFTSNLTLYPEWNSSIPQYTLPTPTKVGYKFVTWNTNSSGTGTNYAAGTSYQLTSNKTFYAIWEPEWTIKINNGTNWGDYHIWIYTGASSNNGWRQAIPYVYDGSNWKITKI